MSPSVEYVADANANCDGDPHRDGVPVVGGRSKRASHKNVHKPGTSVNELFAIFPSVKLLILYTLLYKI
eukprot:SAG22_NODE_9751_length_571_cov_1.940678_2_plen_68_part_01